MIIRKPNMRIFGERNIPKDFYDVMEYFNRGLALGAYKFIPRKKAITPSEIINLWVPSLSRNITYLAEDVGRVIGSGTVLYALDSSAYENSLDRDIGEIALTVDPRFSHEKIGGEIMRNILAELKKKKSLAVLHTDMLFTDEINIMRTLGYTGKEIESFDRYKKAGLSGKVLEFNLP